MLKKLLVPVLLSCMLLAVTPVLAMPPTGEKGGKTNYTLLLVPKDPSTWEFLWPGNVNGTGTSFGLLKFEQTGATFDFGFNGHGLRPNTDYSIIYYLDMYDAWGRTIWPHKILILANGTSNSGGNVNISASVQIGENLPMPGDANYTSGAKIWLVLSSDIRYTSGDYGLIFGWNPTAYLFEYDLITYDYLE